MIDFEGDKSKLIRGTLVLKDDVNGKHTTSYTVFDGKDVGRCTYSIENIEKKE
ncbi:MAG: hypothetical protein QXR21_05920 [Thermoplasmatales archaeon]